jgi:hypothetical protein
MLSLPVIALCLLALPGLTKNGLASATPSSVEPAAATIATFCITDDHSHDNISFTAGGAYTFTRCKDGFTLSGTGTVKMSASVAFLFDKKSDRIVSAAFLINQKTGHADVTLIPFKGIFLSDALNQTITTAACSCT